MDRDTRRRFEAWRADASAPQNQVVDDLFSGECDRAGFIQRATMFGLSVPVMSAALLAAGEAPAAFAKETRGKAGGRIRVGLTPIPKGNLEPWTYQETAALQMGGIAGEFLNRNRPNLTLQPELAVSWKPNSTGSVWTYKLRQGVKFANGQPMTADDVVATYHRLLTDPTSQAASAFSGVLSDAGVSKVDDYTVRFKLDTPTASFPYLTSSSTYQAIILPKNYAGPFESKPQTTGAFNLVSYTPGVGAKYDRNPNWWGGSAPLDGVDVTLGEQTALNNALTGGQLDLLNGIVYFDSRSLFTNKNIQIFSARGATHREIPMRVDQAGSPLKDPRVRRAIALTLNRPQIVKTLFNGKADLGNDSPFAPVYPSTAVVPQRHQDIRLAKQLIAAAGYVEGLQDEARHLLDGRAAQPRADRPAGREIDRRHPRRQDPHQHAVLRGHPDHDAMAERADDDHRLGPSRRSERAAQRGAHQQGDPQQGGRHVERGALQEQEVRRARQGLRRDARAGRPEEDRQGHRAAPARRDARDLPLLLQLVQRGFAEGQGLRRRPARRDLPEQDVAVLSDSAR